MAKKAQQMVKAANDVGSNVAALVDGFANKRELDKVRQAKRVFDSTLKLLKDFYAFLDQNEVPYTFGGTLTTANKHNRLIPELHAHNVGMQITKVKTVMGRDVF